MFDTKKEAAGSPPLVLEHEVTAYTCNECPVILSPGSKSLPSQLDQEAVCLTRLVQMLHQNGNLL